MTISEDELEKIFHQNVPKNIQEALVRCLFGSYRASYRECSNFPPEEKHDFLGYHRWIRLRTDLRGVAERFHPQMSFTERPWHTRLNIGQIWLTASSVQDPSRPKWASYRGLYAATSQYDLFEKNITPPPDSIFYAIMLHHPDERNPQFPSFMRIAFPDKRLDFYVCEINMFSLHAELVKSMRKTGEAEGMEIPVTLRKDIKKAKEA